MEKNKITSVQGLRGLAFLGIFICHAPATFFGLSEELGVWGVSIFLILSGYLMAYGYENRDIPISGNL